MIPLLGTAYKLGKKAASHSITLKFENVFDVRKLPKPPPGRYGRHAMVRGGKWGILGNDTVGNCVWAGASHEDMIFTAMGGAPVTYRTADVIGDYSACTGYDPAVPDSDEGTDMKKAASYRRKTGILAADGSRQKVDGFAALKIGSIQQIEVATYLFGACGLGVQLPKSAMDQFDNAEPWHRIHGRDPNEGGHYVSHVGRNSANDQLVVTWGRIHAATDDWIDTYMDEGVAYLDFSVLDKVKRLSPDGYDEEKLKEFFGSLG